MSDATPDETMRARVLRVADSLLDEAGPDQLSLRKIAELADTSTQAVYTQFGGKPGLVDAMYRSGYQRLADELDGVPDFADPIERIRALGLAYRRVALANPEHYKLMTGRPIADFDAPRDSLRFAASTMQPLVDAVREACDVGALDGDPRTIAMRFWAAGHGRVSLELQGLVEVDDDEASEYIDRLINAHRPRRTGDEHTAADG
ncbi:MAG: TetR/AcrR family transcriptional regulator [Actinomycetota bacterium]